MGETKKPGRPAGGSPEWTVPGADVGAGAAEVVRLSHACLPSFRWGRRAGGAYVAGPAPLPRRLPEDLSDGEHAAFLVRLAGLLSFIGSHGLGLGAGDVAALGARPGSRDVPWLAAAPVPAWRAIAAPLVVASVALRLAGKGAPPRRQGEARRYLEAALDEGLPSRCADAVTAALRADAGTRPVDALLLDLSRGAILPDRVAGDLLGLGAPRCREAAPGELLVAVGPASDWIATGASRRLPGEAAFAESGPPGSLEDGALLLELAEGLGPDPRAEALRALAREETPDLEPGPPLVLLARDVEGWDARSRAAWEELPRFLGSTVRVETREEAPAPWRSAALVGPRLGREEIAGLVHLPLSSPAALARLWEELAEEAGGDAARLLRSARSRARAFFGTTARAASGRRPGGGDVVLRAAALLGDGFAPSEAAVAAGASVERAAAAIGEAFGEGILRRAGRDGLRFSDDGERRRRAGELSRAERLSALARLSSAGLSPLRLLLARLSAGEPAAPVVAEAREAFVHAAGNGRGAEALALLDRAPASSPHLGEPLLAAELLAAAGRMVDARTAAAAVVVPGATAEDPARCESAARLLARLGEAEKALALLPEDAGAEGRLARADLLLRLRREEEAARLLDATAGDGRLDARRRLLRAELLERRQELAAAESELRAATAAIGSVADAPGLDDLRFSAGYVALGLGRPGEARELFRAARDAAREPSRKADALYDLSVAAAADGDLAGAEASLEEALRLYSAAGERERYVTALGQRAALALLRSDARAAHADLRVVLSHDRAPGRSFQLLFSVPLRQRLALADGDGAEAAEAFAEAAPLLAAHPAHPATREVLVLEGARLLAAGLAAEALSRLGEAEPYPDARSGVEPLRTRLAASARGDLGRPGALPASLDAAERELLLAEQRLARGAPPGAAALRTLAARLERPEGPVEVVARLLEWRGRFSAFFAAPEAEPFREVALRAARRAGLDGAVGGFPSVRRAATGAGAPEAVEWGAVAQDEATRELLRTARRVAPRRIPVLLLGESGTGKEVFAREIHEASGRGGPFVAVNVAALPESLAEAELFGAARGAFTGADRDRAGVLEAASGGTLFLDEIGDLALPVQAKLLRALQEREVRRLGETRTRPVDLRLVSATHRDPARLVAEGRFRADLLYRVGGITLTLPPLRERPRDLRALLERALAGAPVSPAARAALLAWSWPGNVRELLSAVEAARALAGDGGTIGKEHLPPALRGRPDPPAGATGRYRRAVDEAKRRVVLETLAEAGGNRTRAAALLGLSRQSLLYEMKRLGITE